MSINLRTFFRRIASAFNDLLDDRPPLIVPLPLTCMMRTDDGKKIRPFNIGEVGQAVGRPQTLRASQIIKIYVVRPDDWQIIDAKVGNRSILAQSGDVSARSLENILTEPIGTAMDVVLVVRYLGRLTATGTRVSADPNSEECVFNATALLQEVLYA